MISKQKLSFMTSGLHQTSRRFISMNNAAMAAKAVYFDIDKPGKFFVSNFGTAKRIHIGPYNRPDLAYWKNDRESIVSIRGSSVFDDWFFNNLPMQLGILPIRYYPTLEFIEDCIRDSDGKPLTVIGHSLGGGLAQLCGAKLNVPIITFNAPPMVSLIDATLRFNIGLTDSQQTEYKEGNNAYNFYTKFDPVSRMPGLFIGNTLELDSTQMNPLIAHGMEEVITAVTQSPYKEIDNLTPQ